VTNVGKRIWWDLAVGAAILFVAALVWWVSSDTIGGYLGALIILGILAIYYYAIGRRAEPGTPGSYALQFVFLGGIAIGAFFSPNMLTLQVVALPMVWVGSRTTRRAVIVNIISVTLSMVGFTLGLGGSGPVVLSAVLIGVVTLAFSLALGMWMTRISEIGQERARLLAELTSAQSELQLLSHEAGAASERERLAREIHDTIAQSLTGLVLLAQRAGRELRADVPRSGSRTTVLSDVGTAQLSETIELIETMAREALGEARSLVATIAGLPDVDAPLADSLGRIGERFARETGVQVEVDVSAGQLSRAVEVVLLRCAQEALSNVRKHANATRVTISVTRGDDSVQLVVRDDGRGLTGYDPDREQGFGLGGMRERLALVGGHLQLEDATGGGAQLTVTLDAPGTVGTASGTEES
jgi:signal transduction histidine kinase